MSEFVFTKKVQAANLAEALKLEPTAEISQVVSNPEPKTIGFKVQNG